MPSASRRVTMKDIARALRLDPSTVSLALKGDSRLKAATKEKIRDCAEKLGYVPDPMLAALSHYRHTGHAHPVTSNLAFLCPIDPKEIKIRHAYNDLWEGARECALSLGYRLELFKIDYNPEHARQLERILKARGISGVIYAPIKQEREPPPFKWEHFSIIMIEGQYYNMPVHRISNDQTGITREAIVQLDKKGYRRIGLAVGAIEEKSLRYAFSAGYHTEMALRPHLSALPPFHMVAPHGPYHPEFHTWLKQHNVEVVLSNWDSPAPAMRAAGIRIPEDIAAATLDLNPREGANAGMRQNTRLVGARALEQLTMLIKTSQRGFIETPNITLIPGTWFEGSDLPDNRAR